MNRKEVPTANFSAKVQQLYSLEQLAAKKTWVHGLHPVAKVFATLAFLIAVLSFGRYEIGRLIPFIFYPAIMMASAEIPYGMLHRRAAFALPFALFAGISNLFFDTGTAGVIGGIAISFGAISFASILLKTYLCVMAALILVAATPMRRLTEALRALHVPRIFITVFEMTYRYLGTLFGEASGLRTAYLLRSAQQKGVEFQHMGSFIGSLLVRSMDRAERVYHAMQCRGYSLAGRQTAKEPARVQDALFFCGILGGSILLRLYDTVRFYDMIGRLLH